MQSNDKANMFLKLRELAKLDLDEGKQWLQVLAITGQSRNSLLTKLDILEDSFEIAKQVAKIVHTDPFPANLTFLYFGLFDKPALRSGEISQGFYLAGGDASNPVRALEDGNLSYFPKHRFLKSIVLDTAKAMETPEQNDLFGYALVFGAAATMTRATMKHLSIDLPVFVGFDEGDYALISRD
jgi:hypothetical protein